MNRLIFTGILALAVGVPGLLAQQPPAGQQQGTTETPVMKQPTVKSQAEAEAAKAMFMAQDPDTRIKAANDLITKFADSDFKPIALFFTAASYEQKGDSEKTILYCEQTLQADPNNYNAMLMLAREIAQHTREFDLDREEKLTKATNYAKKAIELVANAPRPNPVITDQQWASAKRDLTAEAHEALALVALVRKQHDVAITEFKAAIEGATTPDPATMVRLAHVYNLDHKYDDALALANKIMADTNVNPQIKQFAQAERVRALQGKGGGTVAKPATSATPAPGDVKKP